MKKKYVHPTIEAILIDYTNAIASSVVVNSKDTCSRYCKHWHFCLDRQEGGLCHDKEY